MGTIRITLRVEQNGQYLGNDIFKSIFLVKMNCRIAVNMSLKFVPNASRQKINQQWLSFMTPYTTEFSSLVHNEYIHLTVVSFTSAVTNLLRTVMHILCFTNFLQTLCQHDYIHSSPTSTMFDIFIYFISFGWIANRIKYSSISNNRVKAGLKRFHEVIKQLHESTSGNRRSLFIRISP